MRTMNFRICIYSLVLCTLSSLISLYFGIKVFIAVWIGCATGLIGYGMVVRMVLNIPSNEMDGKKVGTQGYMKRYLFYGFILVLCHYLDFNLIGVLIGMMCNKGAILIYALIERKGLHE